MTEKPKSNREPIGWGMRIVSGLVVSILFALMFHLLGLALVEMGVKLTTTQPWMAGAAGFWSGLIWGGR